ncbi:unnamed protein product [Closterium sp. NIES-54]
MPDVLHQADVGVWMHIRDAIATLDNAKNGKLDELVLPLPCPESALRLLPPLPCPESALRLLPPLPCPESALRLLPPLPCPESALRLLPPLPCPESALRLLICLSNPSPWSDRAAPFPLRSRPTLEPCRRIIPRPSTSHNGAATQRFARAPSPSPDGGRSRHWLGGSSLPPALPLNSSRTFEIQLGAAAAGHDDASCGVTTGTSDDTDTFATSDVGIPSCRTPTTTLDFPASPSASSSAEETSASPFASPSASAWPHTFPSMCPFADSIPWPSDSVQLSAFDGEPSPVAFPCGSFVEGGADTTSGTAPADVPAASENNLLWARSGGRKGGASGGGVEAASGVHWAVVGGGGGGACTAALGGIGAYIRKSIQKAAIQVWPLPVMRSPCHAISLPWDLPAMGSPCHGISLPWDLPALISPP